MLMAKKLEKAELREIDSLEDSHEANEINQDHTIAVQFNPESLRLNFSNQTAGEQTGGSGIQFVGAGTTTLAFDLYFDAYRPLPARLSPADDEPGDVRKLTEKVAYFITPKRPNSDGQRVPPAVRFIWGSFLFDGVMDSLSETLEYFSSEGKPLRATLSVSMTSQRILFEYPPENDKGAGRQSHAMARGGDTLYDIAGRLGNPAAARDLGRANGVENLRRVPAGTPINTRPTR